MTQTMKCQAIIEDYKNGEQFRRQRLTIPKQRPCTKAATVAMRSPLGVERRFCTVHARLAEEGLLTVTGQVEPRQTIRDVHNIERLGREFRQQNGWERG